MLKPDQMERHTEVSRRLCRLTPDRLNEFIQASFEKEMYSLTLLHTRPNQKAALLLEEHSPEEVLDRLDRWLEMRGLPSLRRVRILVFIACQGGGPTTKAVEEARAIEGTLARVDGGRVFEVIHQNLLVATDLDAIDRMRPDIVHFASHGEKGGTLHVEGGSPVHAGSFARLNHRPRLVVLSVCDSSGLAAELSQQLDCAIGMRGRITAETAILFSRTFYDALARGKDVDQALRCVTVELTASKRPETDAPKPAVSPSVTEPIVFCKPTLWTRFGPWFTGALITLMLFGSAWLIVKAQGDLFEVHGKTPGQCEIRLNRVRSLAKCWTVSDPSYVQGRVLTKIEDGRFEHRDVDGRFWLKYGCPAKGRMLPVEGSCQGVVDSL